MAEEESTPMEWTPTLILKEEQVKKPIFCLPPTSPFAGLCHPIELVEDFEEEILQYRKMNLLTPNEYDINNAYHYANEAMDQYNKRENENWEIVELVTVKKEEVRHRSKGFVFFITVDVKDHKAGSFDTFQVKILQSPLQRPDVVICRKKRPFIPKPTPVRHGCYPNPVHLIPAAWKMNR